MDTAVGVEATLVAAIRRNSAAWAISGRLAIALLVAPLGVFAGAFILAVAEHPWLERLTDEDGVAEWLQIAALLACCVAFLMFAHRLWRHGRRVTALLGVFVAIGAIAVAGEEISWGQRLLGWSTPPELDAINYQGEFNIHNIAVFDTLFKLGQFVAGGYGTLIPITGLPSRMSTRALDSYVVPPVALVSFFVVSFAYWGVRIAFDPERTLGRLTEITELSLFLGIATFGFLSVRRIDAQPAPRQTNANLERPPSPMA